jgi:hypothetical protein
MALVYLVHKVTTLKVILSLQKQLTVYTESDKIEKHKC